MTFSPIDFLMSSFLAEREGVTDPQARTRLALFSGLFGGGSPATGLALTALLARRESRDSSLPALVVLPSVEELEVAEARRRLESLGLAVVVQEVRSRATRGTITSQNPDPFSVVLEGSTVKLYVSNGMQDEEVLVELPDLVGQAFQEARETLHDLDFRVKRTNVEGEKKEVVVEQDPKFGKVPPEIQVTLFVGTGGPSKDDVA